MSCRSSRKTDLLTFPELKARLRGTGNLDDDGSRVVEFRTDKENDFQTLWQEVNEVEEMCCRKYTGTTSEFGGTCVVVWLEHDFHSPGNIFEQENRFNEEVQGLISVEAIEKLKGPLITFKGKGDDMTGGSIRVPHATKIHTSWWGSVISPEIDPYILRICNACGLSPAQAWDHKPITGSEWKQYENVYSLHAPTRDRLGRVEQRTRSVQRSARFIDGVKVASDMETARVVFRNDHELRKSQLIKQLEIQAMRCIKLAAPDLRQVGVETFFDPGTSPELQEAFVQIVAQSYLIAEALKAKRYMMQKTWARLMKTRAHYVRDFWGARLEGGHLVMDYELLGRKRKR